MAPAVTGAGDNTLREAATQQVHEHATPRPRTRSLLPPVPHVSIGILVIQDLVAVIFLTASSGTLPSPWAFALVLLWPVTRLFR